jgi:cytochrome c peroxidase
MGRFLVVVIVLIALAFLANKYLLGEGDPLPKDHQSPPIAGADAKDAAPADAKPAAADAPQVDPDKLAAKVEAAVADDEQGVPAAPEEAAADAVAAAEVSTDLEEEPGVEPKLDGPKIDVKPADLTKVLPKEKVVLGDPSLTAGIPGEGTLTLEQINAWLVDPKNHVVLDVELPLGLNAGQNDIQGLDENPLTRAKIELGRQLFFDPRLSSDFSISCASCHDPDTGYAAETQFGVGVGGQTGNRNSPVAFNRILSGDQFWDGRAPSLEEQAKGPIANPIEMSHTHEACAECLQGVPGYVRQFSQIFEDGLTIDNVAKAIASFERSVVTGPAPWDYYLQKKNFEEAFAADIEDLDALKEDDPELYDQYMAIKEASDKHPISDSAVRGGELFFSDKTSCTACHLGANFTDEKYHNLGVGMDAAEPDLGRFVETKVDADRGAFKTPTVRNISLTGPYMHDGSQQTLEEVVEWYAKGGHPNQWLSDKIKKLDLTDQDKQDLVAFMKEGLLGELPKVERGRIPADPVAADDQGDEPAENAAEEAKAAS